MESKEGPIRDFNLSEDEWEELHTACWLHDCGKITTPEFVVDKSTKLELIYDRIHEIRMRFEVLKREKEIAFLRRHRTIIANEAEQQQLSDELHQLDDDFYFIAHCNVGGEFMSDEAIAGSSILPAIIGPEPWMIPQAFQMKSEYAKTGNQSAPYLCKSPC